MEMIEAAIRYARMGLAVIPLDGKIPIFRNWPDVATNDIPTLQKWWQQNPKLNLGIATGPKSGVFVVDIDPRHGGKDTWEHAVVQNGGIPETWQDLTGGGGTHIYFRYPNFKVKSCSGLLQGVDIRGEGGQVVAPPSIHPDTKRAYEWDGLKPIWEQPLAEAPHWLLDLLEPKPVAHGKASELPLKIPHGVQHQTLLSLCGMLRRLGLSAEEMLPTVSAVHKLRCERPGPEQNIVQMVQRVARYAPGDANLYQMATKIWRMSKAIDHHQDEDIASMQPIDAYALLKKPAMEKAMVVDGCLHHGCTILAGPPKAGKSYLTLGLGIGVATGGIFIGSRAITKPGRVGYWALEESQIRTQSRLKQLVQSMPISLQNLEFMYFLKPMFQGGLEQIATYAERFRPDLVVIDTLMAMVTGDRTSRRDVFRDDYREIKALSDIASKHDLALVVVHHTNKLGGSGVSAVAGTHGVTAAADCIWTMERQPGRRAVLNMTGREIEDQTFLMELDLALPVGWSTVEQGDDVILSGERQVILEVLREQGPRNPRQLAAEIGKNGIATRQLLYKMVHKGSVIRHDNGNYSLPGTQYQHWNDKDAE